MRKGLHFFIQIVTAMYLFCLAVLIIPGFFGIYVETVTSGSMDPAIPVGSVVYVCPAKPSEIEAGDIITFLVDEKGTKVTHRVVKAERDEEGRSCYQTRGDANEVTDARPVQAGNVLGKVRFFIPFAGALAIWLSSWRGKLRLILILLLLLAASLLTGPEKVKRKSKRRSRE